MKVVSKQVVGLNLHGTTIVRKCVPYGRTWLVPGTVPTVVLYVPVHNNTNNNDDGFCAKANKLQRSLPSDK